MADTWAWPLPLIVTGAVGEKFALAPEAGAVNVTCPPTTGSPKALVTPTTSGLAKGVLTVVCWLLPLTMEIAKPRLSKAPMSTALPTMRANPRWSVVTPAGIRLLSPASMAGLPGKSGIVCVGPP